MEACIYREKGIERKVRRNFSVFANFFGESGGGGGDHGGGVRDDSRKYNELEGSCGRRRWNSRRI